MWKDSETELDFLDYDYLVRSLTDIITDNTLLPACIGVYGDWGSGKSSLIRMSKTRLEAADKNIKCIIFNGWLFENYEDTKTAILGEILDAIECKQNLSKKAKQILRGLYKSIDKFKIARDGFKYGIDFWMTGGMRSIANLVVKNIISNISEQLPNTVAGGIDCKIKDELNHKELREDVRKFQKQFAELLEESEISRLVVFIDELDRCRPDTILDTLEAIKLFLFTGKTAFVLGADERHIAYAVKSKFKDIEGQEIDIGKEYLEKLIQYPIKIPRLDSNEVETYIGCLLLQNELGAEQFKTLIDKFHEAQAKDFTQASLSDFVPDTNATDSLTIAHQLSGLLAQALNGNPRQCKRFLNMLYLRIKQANYKNKPLDRRILAKMMLLEYFNINIFKKMATLSQDGKLSRELTILEENQTANASGEKGLEFLKDIENELWVMTWCQIEPKIGNEDLKPYFYFSRTSLEERLSLLTANLSPAARELTSRLLEKAEIVTHKALYETDNLPIHEVLSIINAIGGQLLAASKVDEIQLNNLLSLVERRQEYWKSGMAILERFSVEQLPSASAPLIAEFAKKSNQIDGLTTLLNGKWKNKKTFVTVTRNSLEQE